MRARARRDVAPVLAVLRRLARPDQPHGRLLAAAGHVGRRDDHRPAAVADHAALQQVQRIRHDARIQHVLRGDLVHAHELQVRHRLHGFGIPHRVVPCRHRDARELLVRRAVLEHVTLLHHRVVRDQRRPVRGLHVRRPRSRTAPPARADRDTVRGRGRAVAQDRHVALARGDVTHRVRRLELVRGAADLCRVEHRRPKTQVSSQLQAASRFPVLCVVDRVDIAPLQPGVVQRRADRINLHVHRRNTRSYPQGVLVDADDGRLPLLRHRSSSDRGCGGVFACCRLRRHPRVPYGSRVRVALLADTHLPSLIRQLDELGSGPRELLATADLILHAGDVTAPSVLDWCEAFAPVLVAQGNNDIFEDPRLAHRQMLDLEGWRLGMTHELRPESRPISVLLNEGLNGERVDVLIAGDTHVERLEFREDVLFVNPGSP
ncbi:MAG: YfcE family phosphodiesterase, partial [Dehalococcoidia bacterium]|nr:YfcE family phosphodiesterase [Dehalococcoidia bacterium]